MSQHSTGVQFAVVMVTIKTFLQNPKWSLKQDKISLVFLNEIRTPGICFDLVSNESNSQIQGDPDSTRGFNMLQWQVWLFILQAWKSATDYYSSSIQISVMKYKSQNMIGNVSKHGSACTRVYLRTFEPLKASFDKSEMHGPTCYRLTL